MRHFLLSFVPILLFIFSIMEGSARPEDASTSLFNTRLWDSSAASLNFLQGEIYTSIVPEKKSEGKIISFPSPRFTLDYLPVFYFQLFTSPDDSPQKLIATLYHRENSQHITPLSLNSFRNLCKTVNSYLTKTLKAKSTLYRFPQSKTIAYVWITNEHYAILSAQLNPDNTPKNLLLVLSPPNLYNQFTLSSDKDFHSFICQ